MPQQIWIVRHAKSSWADANMSDHDRTLNKRGIHDAPKMAALILDQIPEKLLMYSSTAVRAKMTCDFFNEVFISKNTITRYSAKLYHASEFELLKHINELEEKIENVMIFAHNPGISYFVNRLSKPLMMEIPTCGVIRVKTNADNWSNVNFDNLELVAYYIPEDHI